MGTGGVFAKNYKPVWTDDLCRQATTWLSKPGQYVVQRDLVFSSTSLRTKLKNICAYMIGKRQDKVFRFVKLNRQSGNLEWRKDTNLDTIVGQVSIGVRTYLSKSFERLDATSYEFKAKLPKEERKIRIWRFLNASGEPDQKQADLFKDQLYPTCGWSWRPSAQPKGPSNVKVAEADRQQTLFGPRKTRTGDCHVLPKISSLEARTSAPVQPDARRRVPKKRIKGNSTGCGQKRLQKIFRWSPGIPAHK